MPRRVVYSTTDGDLRKARDPAERERLRGDGKVRVRREVTGRRGKTVTTVSGVPVKDAEDRNLADPKVTPKSPAPDPSCCRGVAAEAIRTAGEKGT